MSRVTIFGDESGTMPEDDGDRPFCVAALATVAQPPLVQARSGHRGDVLRACASVGCVPQVVYVRATPGYGRKLRAKTSKMSTMARASRLMTGSHEYFPDQGYSSRNMVWIRSVALCVARAVMRVLNPDTIEEVEVVLDRKTMTGRERALFTDRLSSQSRDIFRDSQKTYEVQIRWSDDPDASPFQSGLFLAHHVSRLARRALEAGTEEVLAQDLGLGQLEVFYDATHDVIAPLPRWSIEKWKKRTGLPEPSAAE